MQNVNILLRVEKNRPAARMAIGGFQPFTSIDFPGRLAAVIFLSGCPWRCRYCHNRHLQSRAPAISWENVRQFLQKRRGLLDGVVFSGGEPLLQAGLLHAVRETAEMGLETALHTAGAIPKQLGKLLPELDWIGFDVKAPFADYARITGNAKNGIEAKRSLELLLKSGTDYEVRTTADATVLGRHEILRLAEELRKLDVRRFVLQACRNTETGRPSFATNRLFADDGFIRQLERMFPRFTLRGHV